MADSKRKTLGTISVTTQSSYVVNVSDQQTL